MRPSPAGRRVTITEYGPDPLASAWWDGLAERTAGELGGTAAPLSVRVGMKGSPEVTWYGNLGEGVIFQPLPGRTPARNAFFKSTSQALPTTQFPRSSTDDLRSVLAQFDL